MIDQDQQDAKRIIKEIKNLDLKIKEKVMTGLQRIEQKGIELGEQRGFKDAIVKLLAHGMDKAKAAEMLGLTLKKLETFLDA